MRCDLQASNEDFYVLVAVSPGMARRRTHQYVEQAMPQVKRGPGEKRPLLALLLLLEDQNPLTMRTVVQLITLEQGVEELGG